MTDNNPETSTYPANHDELLRDYSALANSVAWAYRNSPVPLEDLKQEAMIGLWQAYQRFDASRGVKFSTYAYYWVKKHVLQAIDAESGHSGASHSVDDMDLPAPPENSQETNLNLPAELPEIEKAILGMSYGQRMSIGEIAKRLNISNEKVRQLRSRALRRLKSIDPNGSVNLS